MSYSRSFKSTSYRFSTDGKLNFLIVDCVPTDLIISKASVSF